jgi:hypothetical protein
MKKTAIKPILMGVGPSSLSVQQWLRTRSVSLRHGHEVNSKHCCSMIGLLAYFLQACSGTQHKNAIVMHKLACHAPYMLGAWLNWAGQAQWMTEDLSLLGICELNWNPAANNGLVCLLECSFGY